MTIRHSVFFAAAVSGLFGASDAEACFGRWHCCQPTPMCCQPCPPSVVCTAHAAPAPGGFGGVSSAAPFGRDVDGAPLLGPPVLAEVQRTSEVVSGDPDDVYRLKEMILNILQRENLQLSEAEARELIEQFRESE
jgi:hypothetical protein